MLGGSRSGVSWMDSSNCQTLTASPAEPGDLPIGLGRVVGHPAIWALRAILAGPAPRNFRYAGDTATTDTLAL